MQPLLLLIIVAGVIVLLAVLAIVGAMQQKEASSGEERHRHSLGEDVKPADHITPSRQAKDKQRPSK